MCLSACEYLFEEVCFAVQNLLFKYNLWLFENKLQLVYFREF